MRPIAASLSVMLLLLLPEPALAADNCWLLKQHHLVFGELDVYIWPKGALVVPQKNDYRFLCTAPDWDAKLYSDKRKLFCKLPYSSWSKKGIRTAMNLQSNDGFYGWPKVPDGKRKLAGMNVSKFAFPYKYPDGRLVDLKNGNVGEYWLSNDFAIHTNVYSFLQALYDLPAEKGLPVRFEKVGNRQAYGFGLRYNRSEERHSVLDTISSKRILAAPAMVASFRGYKSVGEHQIIMKPGDVSGVFQELIGE